MYILGMDKSHCAALNVGQSNQPEQGKYKNDRLQKQTQDQRIEGLTETDRGKVRRGRGNKNGVTAAAVAPTEGREGMKRDTTWALSQSYFL